MGKAQICTIVYYKGNLLYRAGWKAEDPRCVPNKKKTVGCRDGIQYEKMEQLLLKVCRGIELSSRHNSEERKKERKRKDSLFFTIHPLHPELRLAFLKVEVVHIEWGSLGSSLIF